MPSKNQSILLAGVAMGVAASLFSIIPAVGGCIACLLYLGAGLLAAWHYTNTYELTITGGQGAGMGALAGMVTVVTTSVLGWLFGALGLMPTMAENMEEAVQNMRDAVMDPAQIESVEGFITSPVFWVALFVLGLVVGALLGAAGGAIGAAMFKKGAAGPEGSVEAY